MMLLEEKEIEESEKVEMVVGRVRGREGKK